MNIDKTRKAYAERVVDRVLPNFVHRIPTDQRGVVLVEEHPDGRHSAAFKPLPSLREVAAQEKVGTPDRKIFDDIIAEAETIDPKRFYVICFMTQDWMYSMLGGRELRPSKGFGGLQK